MANGLRRFFLLLAISSSQAFGLPSIPLLQPPVQQMTRDSYRAHVNYLRALVLNCGEDANACDASAIGEDDKVVAAGETFQVRWQWLRKLIDDARNPALSDRPALLDQASARLDQELVTTDGEAPTQPVFAEARRSANSILAGPEFRVVGRESWIDRATAAFYLWLNRLFTATFDLGRHSPWIAAVMEWTCVGLSLAGLLLWAMRTIHRQSIDLSLGDQIAVADWHKESAEWADLARSPG